MPEKDAGQEDQLKDAKEAVKKIAETKKSASEFKEIFGLFSEEDERVEKGLLPFATKDLKGMVPGSKKHVMQSLMGTTGAHEESNFLSGKHEVGPSTSSLGRAGKFGFSMGKAGYEGYEKEGLTGMGREMSKELAGQAVPEDLLKGTNPSLAGAGTVASAASAVARLTGHPEAAGVIDSAASPLSAPTTIIKEGAGSYFDLANAAASYAAGDANWEQILEKHNEEGVKNESFLQPLYWLGQVAEGKGSDLSNRLIGEEGRSGKMGRFVEAGNWWGDELSTPGKFTRDMKEMGNFIWEGADSKGGLKGAGKAAGEAVSEAGSYWWDVIRGKGHLGQDLGEMKDYISENVTLEGTLQGAQNLSEGIVRTIGGDELVGMTREASDYWGKVFSGEGHFGQDMKEMGSYMWGGESGSGGIKGAASAVGSAASKAGSYLWGGSSGSGGIKGAAQAVWDWL